MLHKAGIKYNQQNI